MRSLNSSLRIGGVAIANRLMLAPLAGVGNWFVRLQAKRYGAGLVASEMISSAGLSFADRRTTTEFLRIHPDEHPVSLQLFGHDPDVMRRAAAIASQAGADIIDINMGCPVRKVCKTGAGVALLDDPARAVALTRAAREGSCRPVTVKLRQGLAPGDRRGASLAMRLTEQAGASAVCFHPRAASQRHKGSPDYAAAECLAARLEVPLILSGGLHSDAQVLWAADRTGADAVMLARGSLGNPWRFARLLGLRTTEPTYAEITAELLWVIARAEEHLGTQRAGPYLRKFYPWYAHLLGLTRAQSAQLVTAASTADARRALHRLTSDTPTAAMMAEKVAATT